MIFVIRHGETPLNAARIVQMPDTPLGARGLAQAEQLAVRLADAGVARILTSDLRRAVMTAEAIARRTGAPVAEDAVLQERNFGDVRGTPYAELGADIFATDFEPPNGESWPTFHARVRRAWECIRTHTAATDGNLAVVTHGLVCRALVEQHCFLPTELALPPGWANASVTEVEPAPPWRVRVVNCIAHLDETRDGGAAA